MNQMITIEAITNYYYSEQLFTINAALLVQISDRGQATGTTCILWALIHK